MQAWYSSYLSLISDFFALGKIRQIKIKYPEKSIKPTPCVHVGQPLY